MAADLPAAGETGVSPGRLNEKARAKVNLTLAVLGRRADGLHVLDSLVAFAGIADELSLEPGADLSLEVSGPRADETGALADNLVLKAAKALGERHPGLVLGHFRLDKRLPAAAGIGGGSSDAAAALRLLARANGLPLTDERILVAARATGSDVPVCLEGVSRWMRGAGESLSAPVPLPPLPAILVNPGVATPTADVFRALALPVGPVASSELSLAAAIEGERSPVRLIDNLRRGGNDLEPPALALRPAIAEALGALRDQPACRLARMSGSGATVFGLFETVEAAVEARLAIAEHRPGWWVVDTVIC
ncbi:4-(cytidine 5'-diphospho)-2-C-methyl-D-erythritol kinase [Labrys okinawensis]|uniref:4-diphosphocytidyl-2-C-methyl-D-erythritol kinase n=1 Tax=Labrys okinawensis TaxID=346911 RepID=A0A2S9QEQ4_9HYPH|nr:4-(cytidine 5'-diphospho)-2-C-methyl-D-erythritol kinase [Labrys okinawensis]PRH87822.1 4-(cytidine 5'-diphospho)-2-C-methyl-D-erythritol kinase [Labrys okinawensis]